MNKQQPAFTLLEMLIVMCIIATMVALAVPYASRSNDGLAVTQLALNVKETINYAISTATDNARAIRIAFFLKDYYYRLEIAEDAEGTDYKPLSGHLGGVSYYSENILDISSDQFQYDSNIAYLEFNPARNWPEATLTITSKDCQKQITINGKLVNLVDLEF
jgi:prepilin-type N-terminal cleavage/methylation domain-containing protein